MTVFATLVSIVVGDFSFNSSLVLAHTRKAALTAAAEIRQHVRECPYYFLKINFYVYVSVSSPFLSHTNETYVWRCTANMSAHLTQRTETFDREKKVPLLDRK